MKDCENKMFKNFEVLFGMKPYECMTCEGKDFGFAPNHLKKYLDSNKDKISKWN